MAHLPTDPAANPNQQTGHKIEMWIAINFCADSSQHKRKEQQARSYILGPTVMYKHDPEIVECELGSRLGSGQHSQQQLDNNPQRTRIYKINTDGKSYATSHRTCPVAWKSLDSQGGGSWHPTLQARLLMCGTMWNPLVGQERLWCLRSRCYVKRQQLDRC